MKAKDKLDGLIDDHLEDKQTTLGPDFTASVLERVRQDQVEERAFSNRRPWWWIPLFAAAAIALAIYLSKKDPAEMGEITPPLVSSPPTLTKDSSSDAQAKVEMEEIFVMEESLRDFAILLDENALDILALLEE